ncbi:hypothetical protein IKF63_01675 [Candidatus Saccharibacteria bacterium]|nr:hypothetical protein [Candidatus Saccharibacteria bacterium]
MDDSSIRTIFRDKDGRFWFVNEYMRKETPVGETDKSISWGVDWGKTKEKMEEITDEELISALEKIHDAGAMKIDNADPDFFAVGAVKLAEE